MQSFNTMSKLRPITAKFKRFTSKAELTPITAKIMDRHCTRKKQYPNKNAARCRAGESTKRIGEYIEPYKCKYAKHWHIGHGKTSND